MRLGEHRGREDSPDSWKSAENPDVTVLAKVGIPLQLIQDLVEAGGQLRELLVEQAQSGEQQLDGLGQGLGSAGSHGERRLSQQVR